MSRCASLLGLIVAFSLGSGVTHAQTTHNVILDGIVFDPASVTVDIGDTVHWEWVTGNHNVESGVIEAGLGVPDGNFLSGAPTSVPGATFDLLVDQAFLDANPMPGDVYPYYCFVHTGVDMAGTISISPPIPTVSEWGVAAMILLILTAGTVVLARGRSTPA